MKCQFQRIFATLPGILGPQAAQKAQGQHKFADNKAGKAPVNRQVQAMIREMIRGASTLVSYDDAGIEFSDAHN
jgi:hypothetical protein